MLANDILTITPNATFSLVQTRATSSLRSDAAQPVDEPRTLTISHESQTNGKISTAVIIDDVANVSSIGITTASNVRVMMKLQYNPKEGRTDINTVVPEVLGQIIEILSNSTTVSKLLNKEH